MLTNMAVVGSETMSNIKLLAVASVFVLVLTVVLVALRETQFGGGSRVALAVCVAALATIGVYQYVDFILVVYAAFALAMLGLFGVRFYLKVRGFWRAKQASPPPQSAQVSPLVLADDAQPS